MRALLVAAGLYAGATSAWAEDVYTEVYQKTSEEGTNQWSADDVTAWGSTDGLGIQAETNYFGFAGTTANSASYTISAIENNAKVKYEVEWYVKSTNGGYGSMYSYLKLGNLYIRVTDNWKNNDIGFSTDGGVTYCTDLQSNKTQQWVRGGNIVTVDAILNTANDVVESMSVVIDGTTYTATNLTTKSLSGSNDKIIGLGASSTKSGKSTSLIKSITVSQCPQAVTEATYTINYQLNGTTVKTVAGTSVVGAEITALTAIDGTEEGYVGNHYLATAAVAPSLVLDADAASNVLNVPVRAPYTATVNVTTTLDGVAQTPVATVFTETDAKVCDWSYFWTMYTEKDGKFYVASDVSKFGETGTFTDGETINKTVAYTLAPTVAAYMEAESANTNSSNNTNYSGGKTGYVTGNNSYSLGTLPAGTYNLVVYLQDRGDRGIYLRSGSTTGTEIINLGTDKYSAAGVYNSNFTLTENTALYLTGYTSGTSTNQCANIDYILITAVSVSGTIASGYSSLASAYGLDFANATGLTAAFVVTEITKDAVTLSPVNEVPAGTGVILKGSGAYSIPVKADASFSGTNLLNAAVEAYDCAANEVYILQGGEFHLVTAASTVPAGKAYLSADDVPVNARSLTFEFGDEATGISAVSQEVLSGEFYNLQGQRVDAPKKGLYIVNGKKVIIK